MIAGRERAIKLNLALVLICFVFFWLKNLQMNHSASSFEKSNCFRTKFKYYKSRKPKPSLENVLTLSDKSADIVEKDTILSFDAKKDQRTTLLGLKELNTWKLYSFRNHPGLLLIKNPFTSLGQRYWIRRCLEEYPKKPNKKNIDIEGDLEDWWQECFKDGWCERQLQKKMRWTTLGYHHNWDTKVYTDENRSEFPEDLAELSDVVANYLGYTRFKAEAAIVNYYHMDSTLSPHTDHSEVNLNAPLLSFSFGQSAIFLLGSIDKTIEPSAIMLNSGDIVIMSKEARLCYHAVPKILPAADQPWNHTTDMKSNNNIVNKFRYISDQNKIVLDMMKNLDPAEWMKCNNYIAESRINMNVRQVLNENQTSLEDS